MKLLCPLSTAAASLLFLWAVILPAAENPSPVLTAGLAKIDITPRVPVRMVGYASRDYEGQPTKGRLFARALVIGSGGKAESLMITADLLGIPRSLSDRVFERVEKRLGLTREQFAISATHTHGGPSLSQYMQETHFCADLTKEQKKHIDEYTDWLVERFEEIAVEAAGKLQPAVLRWGEGYASFAMNRRVIQNGKWIGMRPNPTGSVDHRVPMLTVARADDEHSILGVFLSYACHCTSYAPPRDSFHGDWAEAASTEIERRHPGSVALVAAGCGADANPDPRTARAAPFIEKHGREIASQVDWLLAHRESSLTLTSPPKGKLRTVSLPLATQPGREDFVKWTQGKDKRRAYYGQMWLDRLDAGQTVPKSFDYLVQTWRFAADQERCLTTVFLPGEVVSDYALRIRDELDTDARKHWVIGYANESPCYITTAQQNAEGGYEVEQSMISYDKTSPLAPETEDLIVGAVAELSGGEPNTPQTIPPRPLPNDQPLSPEQGLASMHVPAGFKVELAAAEPLVMDPVSLDWGPDGRLWVAEMRDYPNGFTWNGAGDPLNEPGGRIKVLTDTDGDGRYDKAEVFLDGLHYPSSVKVWNRGVLVTAAPEIFYAEDTDGDGKADLRETWFSGFARSNQQHRVNSLAWGLDNWLHVANGDGGGLIESEKGRDKVDIRGFDLRIDPFSREIQPLLGRTQCGRYRNDWGDWFGCNNSNPLWHYPLPWDRLQRNANLTAPRAFVDVPREPGAAPVYPLSETLARFNQPDRANRFTSACGPTIYRDRVLALGTAENAFVCEPVHNLVSRQVLTPQGATFSSERAPGESKSEFFASTDTWSRPVSVRTGPDGALWIADMYRLVIEHPEWIPKEWQDKLELRAGHDGGRIYRVVPASGASPKVPRFDALDAAGLVDQLESPNGTVRDLAHQMLLWRPSDEAVPRLQEKARSGKNPAARLHALCVLDGLGKLDANTVRAALADAHPGVVRHAVRLSVGRMGAGELAEIVASRLDDAAVALEVAGVLDTKDEAATRLLAALLLRHRDEPYVTAVALSSVNRDNLKAVLDPLLLAYNDTHAFQKRLGDWDANLQAPPDQLIQTLARFAAMWKVDAAIDAIVATLAQAQPAPSAKALPSWQLAILNGLLGPVQSLNEVVRDEAQRQKVSALAAAARSVVSAETQSFWRRSEAVRLLGCAAVFDGASDLNLLVGQLTPTTAPELRAVVFETLGRIKSADAAKALLARWTALPPGDRAMALNLLLSRSTWTEALLDAVESGSLPRNQIDAASRRRLLASGFGERAEAALQAPANAPREEVLKAWAGVLDLPGDATRGKAVFATACVACHRLEEVGNAVGPDLAALTDHSPQAMLVAILDPNRAVEDKFVTYAVSTKDGGALVGMIADENASGFTLRQADGSARAVLRSELASMTSIGMSLMPEGLENTLSKPQLADVIAYLGSLGGAAHPTSDLAVRVGPGRNGLIELRASKCRVDGDQLAYVPGSDALGEWKSENGRAQWTIVLDRPGDYRVEWEYAAAPEATGNAWQLRISGEKVFGGKVASTGGWDQFQTQTLGEVHLPAADNHIVLQSDGPIQNALLALRAIRFVPVAR